MATKSKKTKVPKSSTVPYGEVMVLRDEVHTLRLTLATIGFRVMFARDVLEHAGTEVDRRGRMNPKIANDLKLQILTMENIMTNVLCLPQDAVDRYRKGYRVSEFEAAVQQTADEIAPALITPAGAKVKPGKFILN